MRSARNQSTFNDLYTFYLNCRVPAAEIFKLSLSPFFDDIAVFHVRAVRQTLFPPRTSQTSHNAFQSSPTRELRSQPNIPGCLSSEAVKRKGDFVFQTGHVIEIVTKLFLVVQNATGKPPAVNISTQFDANFGTHSVTFQFKVGTLRDTEGEMFFIKCSSFSPVEGLEVVVLEVVVALRLLRGMSSW